MSQDPTYEAKASLMEVSLEARHEQLARPTPQDLLNERRAQLIRTFAELGFDELAARFEALPGAMGITRMSDGKIRAMNDDCLQLLGHSYADCVGKTVAELSIWADSAGRERFVAALRRHGEVTDMEARLRRVDGVTVPVLISGRLLEVQGEHFILSRVHDIIERKRAEGALRRSEEHYRSIVTAMDEAAVFLDRCGGISSANPAAERILGLPAEDLVGRPLEDCLLKGAHVRVDGSPLPMDQHPALTALRTGESQSCRVMGVRRPDGSLIWISVNSQALVSEGESEPHGSLSTFRDITTQVEAEAELKRREFHLERLLNERDNNLALVRRSLASVVRVISEVVELRDPYTSGHQRRVSDLATRIARELAMSAAQIEEIRVAGLLHDVGKIAVPAEILSKPGTLTAPERSLIMGHAEAGYRVISSAEMAGDTAEIVYQHHERCDGSGYPRGLSGDRLLLGAKVLMVADVVEAMTSHRPYRAALGLDAALEEIDRGAGGRYAADVCRACIVVVRHRGFAFSEPSLRSR